MIALLLGVLLGTSLTIFTIQNAGIASVHFLAWQFSAPLAFTLVGVIAATTIATLLGALPTLMKLEKKIKTLEIEKKAISDELAKYSITIPIAPPEHASAPTGLPTYSTARETVIARR